VNGTRPTPRTGATSCSRARSSRQRTSSGGGISAAAARPYLSDARRTSSIQ
jgi:hypothetical protein